MVKMILWTAAVMLIFLYLIALFAEPQPTVYYVDRVIDGDTISLTSGERVRILGLDCPERFETGYGAATRRLDELLPRTVTLTRGPTKADRYGRTLAYVEKDGRDIGAQLIREGYCEHYTRFRHPRFAQYAAFD